MVCSGNPEGVSLNQVFLGALHQTMEDYVSGQFRPLSERDIQAYLYTWCTLALRDKVSVLPVHLERRLIPSPPGWSRNQRVDLTVGEEVAVELKFEPLYPGVSTPVAESRQALADMERLRQLKALGFQHCHFVFIDEHGMHVRNRNRLYDGCGGTWATLLTPRGTADFLHWTAEC